MKIKSINLKLKTMFTTIAQGVDAYRKEVTNYLEWFDELNIPKELPIETKLGMMDTPDYNKLFQWKEKMKGMAEALGLTEKEVKEIDAELSVTA